MSSSDDEPLSDIANPTTNNTETPANVAPDEARSPSDEARPPSTIADLTPVPNANTPSGAATIVTALLEFVFIFASGAARLPVDEQAHRLTIGSLRQLAAYFGTSTHEQNKERLCLVSLSWRR